MWKTVVALHCVATKDALEMPCIDDEEMIETLGSDGSDESLGIGARCLGDTEHRRLTSWRVASSRSDTALSHRLYDRSSRLIVSTTEVAGWIDKQPKAWEERTSLRSVGHVFHRDGQSRGPMPAPVALPVDEAETHLASGIVDVRVDQHDPLPGPQRGRPADHRKHERRRDEQRKEMVPTVADRAMPMEVPVVAR
jgi:hypothetical protein